ncbi:Qat anti-phage system QueC-like protein QatC [Mycolicibacterium gadium]|uniref:7-cyano-7-deazaguanine synthase n=1 Tax=Mycolicibacterium gadium TaxID=1794 RepID=A0ABT6GUI2_MYCGU|nr:Qat anti-phage system QueC-like protein QatC [Mycolicibacterium gadium]MDG5485483.1 hypothetical protein [Mycolicibacterium gadium]
MKRHVFIGHFGPGDLTEVPLGADERPTKLDFLSNDQTIDYGIGHALVDLDRLGVHPPERSIDLLTLAAHVHAADTRVSRDSEAQDGWTRELRLVVPVSDPDLWYSVAPTFRRMLNFLTGDKWTLQFRLRSGQFASAGPTGQQDLGFPQFDTVALFSGGLDSLIGAVNLLEQGRTPLLISHAGDPAASEAQTKLHDALITEYVGRAFNRLRVWLTFPDSLVEDSAGEPTTRGRSFLFFALGVFAGTGLPEPATLLVPENGLIALNVPLDPLRLGALSTRTTHPFYIARWNDALQQLDLGMTIENPYWDKTKGEMVRQCANRELIKQLASTSISCSSPSKGRWQGLGIQQCGYCLPCLIRRASLASGLHPDPDPTTYTLQDLTGQILDTQEAEGVQIRSFQFAIDRIRARPELASVLIYKPGPLSDVSPENLNVLADLYRRGLTEVGDLLEDVRTRPV